MSGTRVSKIVDKCYLNKPIYSGAKANYIEKYFKDHPETNYCNTLKTTTDPKLKDNFSVLHDRDNNTYWVKYVGFKNNPKNILGLGGHIGEHQTRVKLVQNMMTGQWSALKIIKKSTEYDITKNDNINNYNRSLFEHECYIAQRLHLNYSFIETNTSLCIIQPIRNGLDLYDYLDQHNDLSLNDRLSIAISLLEEVKKFHDNGIIHRDIKLENFVIVGKTQAHLIDFTSAIEMNEINLNNGFATFLYGTRGYIHPEIKQGYKKNSETRQYSTKSDLYATLICIGICLGFCEFSKENDDDIIFKEEPHTDTMHHDILFYLKSNIDMANSLNSLPTVDESIRFFKNIQNRPLSPSNTTLKLSTEKKRKLSVNQMVCK